MKNETDMKKTYKTPAMKVRKIRCSQMLCESLTSVGEVTQGSSCGGGLYDHIEIYGYSNNPD